MHLIQDTNDQPLQICLYLGHVGARYTTQVCLGAVEKNLVFLCCSDTMDPRVDLSARTPVMLLAPSSCISSICPFLAKEGFVHLDQRVMGVKAWNFVFGPRT